MKKIKQSTDVIRFLHNNLYVEIVNIDDTNIYKLLF